MTLRAHRVWFGLVAVIAVALLFLVVSLGGWSTLPWAAIALLPGACLCFAILCIQLRTAVVEVPRESPVKEPSRTRLAIPACRVRMDVGGDVVPCLSAAAGKRYEPAEPESYQYETVPSTALEEGDVVLVKQDQLVPANGAIVRGTACLDEAVVTGESSPVLRGAGDESVEVWEGTRVVSGSLMVVITRPAA